MSEHEETQTEIITEAVEAVPMSDDLSQSELKRILESLLFVSDKPLSLDRLCDILREIDRPKIRQALEELRSEYQAQSGERGVVLQEVAQGFQLRSHPDHAPWIKRLVTQRPMRLSQASLEVLAVVAYRQPATRAQIESIRGVDCGGVLRFLLERDLVRVIGKVDEPGRPMLYGTTKFFMEVFGLKDLESLPTLKEFQELTPEESSHFQMIRPLNEGESESRPHEPGFLGGSNS